MRVSDSRSAFFSAAAARAYHKIKDATQSPMKDEHPETCQEMLRRVPFQKRCEIELCAYVGESSLNAIGVGSTPGAYGCAWVRAP